MPTEGDWRGMFLEGQPVDASEVGKKRDSLTQGLQGASTERNDGNHNTWEESRALGLLRCGDEGGGTCQAFPGRPTLSGSRGPRISMKA